MDGKKYKKTKTVCNLLSHILKTSLSSSNTNIFITKLCIMLNCLVNFKYYRRGGKCVYTLIYRILHKWRLPSTVSCINIKRKISSALVDKAKKRIDQQISISLVTFPHSPILNYAFSSWVEKTMTKTIRCHWENRFVFQ